MTEKSTFLIGNSVVQLSIICYNTVRIEEKGLIQMFFKHENIVLKDGCFSVNGNVTALAASCLNKTVLKEFWCGYTFGNSAIEFDNTDKIIFSIGNTSNYEPADFSYVIAVEKNGIFIKANGIGVTT